MSIYFTTKGVSYNTESSTKDSLQIDQIKKLGEEVSEFLGCFCLYGFDANGRPIKIYHATSDMEKMAIDALMDEDLSRNVLFQISGDDMDDGFEDEEFRD